LLVSHCTLQFQLDCQGERFRDRDKQNNRRKMKEVLKFLTYLEIQSRVHKCSKNYFVQQWLQTEFLNNSMPPWPPSSPHKAQFFLPLG
jgi:hypothetical protein